MLERFQHLSAALACLKRVKIARMAAELETCRRTISRDLEFMRDRLGLPISSDRHGYFFSEPVRLCRACSRRRRPSKGTA